MYPYNQDEQTPDFRGVDYVPVVNGHLNGAKSLQANYRYLKEKSKQIAGDIPATVFIDWPTDMMTNYLDLPLSEKQDYWQTFGAEAYANGLFPAFHLKDTVGSPTAAELGLMDFFTTYTRFYNHDLARLCGSRMPVSSCRQGRLTVTVDRLDHYNVLMLK